MWDKNILIYLPVSVYIYANIITFTLLDLHSTECILLSYFCYLLIQWIAWNVLLIFEL